MALAPYRSFGLFAPSQPQNHTGDDDPVAHWKQGIGFSEEPAQDAQGFWTIGYGQRLNDTPGGPRPYATISEPIAHDELNYFMAQGGDPSTRINPTPETISEGEDIGPTDKPQYLPSSGGYTRGQHVGVQGNVTQEDIDAIPDDILMPDNSIGGKILEGAVGVYDAMGRLIGKKPEPPPFPNNVGIRG